MAGAPCPIELMKDVVCRMGVKKMTIAYGLTEASPMTHQTDTDDLIERRTSTVGKPLQNTEAKIVDPQTFKELGANETGEIWVRGYHVMLGYYNNPGETEKTIIDGWLRTDDLGIKDTNGYYKIVGRLKEMFIVGGHNVYPAEIEQALRSNFENEIEDVYVFGVPHQTLQEIGAAAIKLKSSKSLTEEEIKSKCADLLEWPKIPKYIKFVNDFTNVMTPTGKIQRKKLKEIFVKELGLEELEKIKTA
jgi:fatty-acyl-CoA synthase